jgi:hypothetical protein
LEVVGCDVVVEVFVDDVAVADDVVVVVVGDDGVWLIFLILGTHHCWCVNC